MFQFDDQIISHFNKFNGQTLTLETVSETGQKRRFIGKLNVTPTIISLRGETDVVQIFLPTPFRTLCNFNGDQDFVDKVNIIA
jgi:hypothetical protein